MIRWLRVVWPPWWALLPAVVICAASDAMMLYFNWLLGGRFLSAQEERPMQLIAGLIACFYALYRVGAFHPALRTEYCQWLRGTPWMAGKRLPLGPVHLVAQDVLMLSLAVAMVWPTLHADSVVIVAAFFFCHLIAVGVMNFITGAERWAYALGIGIGFMVLSVHNYPMFGVAALVCCGVAYLGLQAALAQFPWEDLTFRKTLEQQQKDSGWPYRRLGPGMPELPPITRRDALALGALAGWWFFAVSYQLRPFLDHDAEVLMGLIPFLAVGVLVRLGIYLYGYMPPISLMGRLVHGRLIVPGYDQVFVAPLLALLVVVAAVILILWTGLDPVVATAVAFALTWWILLGIGPSLQAWRLTGNHRISPGLLNRSQFIQ